jgi:contact-dependent growth inhibition (CDI) system CdiI-like immunity protein
MSDVVPEQFAAAYRHPAFLWVDTWSGCGMTAFDPDGVQHVLPPDSSDAALGEAVLDALAHSRSFTPQEVQASGFFNWEKRSAIYSAWAEKLVSARGLKNRKALFKDLDYCAITATAGQIAITPKHHVKLEAWEEVPGVADLTVAATSSPAEIGATLRKAFALCTKK